MARNPQRRVSDISHSLVDEIVETKPRSPSLGPRKKTDLFLRRYFADVPFEDMQGRSPVIMGQAAVSHLEFARVRKPGQALLRIFNPDKKQHGYQLSLIHI